MPKPIRHNNHILETKSNKFFSNQIPDDWITDKPEHDYRICLVYGIKPRPQHTCSTFQLNENFV